MPAGNSLIAAADLFRGPRFERLLAAARSEYDLVIMDFSSLAEAPDAEVAAAAVDRWAVVSGPSGAAAEDTAARLEGAGGTVIGIAFSLHGERRAAS